MGLLLNSLWRLLGLESLGWEVKIEPEDTARLSIVCTHGVIVLRAYSDLLEFLLNHVRLLAWLCLRSTLLDLNHLWHTSHQKRLLLLPYRGKLLSRGAIHYSRS